VSNPILAVMRRFDPEGSFGEPGVRIIETGTVVEISAFYGTEPESQAYRGKRGIFCGLVEPGYAVVQLFPEDDEEMAKFLEILPESLSVVTLKPSEEVDIVVFLINRLQVFNACDWRTKPQKVRPVV